MSKKKSIHKAACTNCQMVTDKVKEYGTRTIQHYTVGIGTSKTYSYITFRCINPDCCCKTFRHYPPVEGIEELDGRSLYSKSSKQYAVHKMLTQQVSYNGLHEALQSDFGTRTSLYSLYTWTQKATVEAVALPEGIKVLHTDEKHPSKKSKSRIKNS